MLSCAAKELRDLWESSDLPDHMVSIILAKQKAEELLPIIKPVILNPTNDVIALGVEGMSLIIV